VPIDEKHPKQPQSPYSASKIGADAIAMSFYNAFALPVTTARPFNTYGPRQSSRAIIPTIITQIISGMKQIKVGDLRPTRDFNFVEDTCRGFLAMAESDSTIGREINIASNFEISMLDTLNLIRDILKSDIKIIADQERKRPANSEVLRLWGDNSLLKKLTGFTPQITFRTGLEITCEWYRKKENLANFKPGIYNI
jgi:nucleoside-diphosphate-sugar epimerase